jgi:hypothetical protein
LQSSSNGAPSPETRHATPGETTGGGEGAGAALAEGEGGVALEATAGLGSVEGRGALGDVTSTPGFAGGGEGAVQCALASAADDRATRGRTFPRARTTRG